MGELQRRVGFPLPVRFLLTDDSSKNFGTTSSPRRLWQLQGLNLHLLAGFLLLVAAFTSSSLRSYVPLHRTHLSRSSLAGRGVSSRLFLQLGNTIKSETQQKREVFLLDLYILWMNLR